MSVRIYSERRQQDGRTFERLDELDRALIVALQDDARLRTAELARRVGLSAPAVAERLRRLTEEGVLAYRAEVDPRALGYPVCAIVRVRPWARDLKVIPAIARDTPEVTECYRITGEDCYFMRMHLRSFDDLEPLLDRFTPYGRTTTSIVHSTPVPPRPLPMSDPEVRPAGDG
jgi:Lrp/AsnC family transcriptional regulator, leucine-responsive regulatory protein